MSKNDSLTQNRVELEKKITTYLENELDHFKINILVESDHLITLLIVDDIYYSNIKN